MTRMGNPGARAHWQGRRMGPRRSLGRLPAGRCERAMSAPDTSWPCNDDKYITHFPRDQRDLVLRFGLRRQRPARQEVLRTPHRLHHGSPRWLDGRAHADPPPDRRGNRQAVPRNRCLPLGLWQDEPCHAAAHRSRATRLRRSVTTLLGCARMRRVVSVRSTPRLASSALLPAPPTTPTRWQWTRLAPTPSSPTSH